MLLSTPPDAATGAQTVIRADEAAADFTKAIDCGHTSFMPYLALSHALTAQCSQVFQCSSGQTPEADRTKAQKLLADALQALVRALFPFSFAFPLSFCWWCGGIPSRVSCALLYS